VAACWGWARKCHPHAIGSAYVCVAYQPAAAQTEAAAAAVAYGEGFDAIRMRQVGWCVSVVYSVTPLSQQQQESTSGSSKISDSF
jgi:hypothetical protein